MRVEIELLDPNPFAPRVELRPVEELANSLCKHGQLSSIKVRKADSKSDHFQIVFGHRRVAAAKRLGWNSIEADLLEVSDEQMVSLALAENLERNSYSDYEVGLLLRSLSEDFGKTTHEIAELFGRSISYVSDHISMTHLFDSADITRSEASLVLQRLSERQARILKRIDDNETRVNLARMIISEDLGVKEIEKLVGHPRKVVHGVENEGSNSETGNEKIKDESVISDIVDMIITGLSNKDIRPIRNFRVANLFTLFDEFPPLLDLLDYEHASEHNWNTLRQMDELKVGYNRLQIHTFGKVAYSTLLVTYQMLYQKKWANGRSRVTMIFVKLQNNWKIVHEHWSAYELGFVIALQKPELEL